MTRSWTLLALLLPAVGGCVWVDSDEHAARLKLLDSDGDGYIDAARGGDDCDDGDPEVYPRAPERCAHVGDDDCDGRADDEDDDVVDAVSSWPDADRDGFGDASQEPIWICPGTPGQVENGDDCDDADPEIYPGAPEACPGYGPDRDCSDEPAPCELPLADSEVLLKAMGFGESLAGAGPLLAARVGTEVVVWNLDGGVDALDPKPKYLEGGVLDSGLDPSAYMALSVCDAGVLVGLPERGDFGEVVRATMGLEGLESLILPGEWKLGVGEPVGWIRGFGGSAAPTPVTLDTDARGGSGNLLVASGEGWDTGPAASNSTTAIVGAELEGQFVLAVRSRAGGGRIEIRSGEDIKANTGADVTIGGEPGMDLGAHLALADLDHDGALDLVATTVEAVLAWRGPFVSGDLTVADAWWSQALPQEPAALAVGNFNDDPNPDIAVGMPTNEDGVGIVYVLTSTESRVAGRGGAPRVEISGAQLGDRVGASLALVDVDGDGLDDLVLGVPGEDRIRVVLGQSDW